MKENTWTPDPDHITDTSCPSPADAKRADERSDSPDLPQNEHLQSQPQDNAPQGGDWQSRPQDNAPQDWNWQSRPQDNAPQGGDWQNPSQDGGWQSAPQNNSWQNGPQNAPWQMPPSGNYGNPGSFYDNPNGHGNYGQEPPRMTPPPSPGGPEGPKPPADKKEVTAILLGVISLMVNCCCFPYGVCLGFAAGMAGLVLSIQSRKDGRFSSYATTGLILSIIGLVGSLMLFALYVRAINLLKDPQFSAMVDEIIRQYQNSWMP